MSIKILSAKRSNRPLSETMLTEDGPITSEQLVGLMDSYELRVEIFTTNQTIPDRTVVVGQSHYRIVFEKYSMDDLKQGIKIDSLFEIFSSIELDGEVVLEEEVDVLAQKIIDELPFMVGGIADYKNYPPSDLKKFLIEQILGLKEKFKIQPK